MKTLFIIAALFLVACGSDSSESGTTCEPSVSCLPGETTASAPCATCCAVDDGCDGVAYCKADACQPCAAGEYQEFGSCTDASCVTRDTCGEPVTCRSQAVCLAEAVCPNGGTPLETCPADATGCLPRPFCGVDRYCVTLKQCAIDACEAGEVATTLACSDASIKLPCRQVDACGGTETVQCVCGSDDLACDEEETYDTQPCVAGQQCREVTGCGITFYCKGNSI